MPRVKIDYVVSFSNEDPENQASNLLSWEVSKKRWLCSPGEPTCSVVLQLVRAVKISSVQIGVHHAALVEVLVGRSETPHEPFQVLVPRSVFLSPAESRAAGAGGAGDRVRSFSGAALPAAAAQRWDRLRLVCSQPYNKHCKYGISFIHIFEPDGEPGSAPAPAAPTTSAAPAPSPAAPAVPPRVFALDTFSSDEEEFRPGELFAKYRQSAGDTGAQIRQATSQALKKNPVAATKLMKTSLSKEARSPAPAPAPAPRSPPPRRDCDKLLYTEDEERPHHKIDQVMQRHHHENKKEPDAPKHNEKRRETNKVDKTPHFMPEEPSTSRQSVTKRDGDKEGGREKDDGGRHSHRNGESSSKRWDENRKRRHSERDQAKPADGTSPGRPLAGVVLVLSGYVNPERARLRACAADLGARCQRDWGPNCTHLICAFSNTPKLAMVRGGARGDSVPVPTGAWLHACARARSRLPWQWFAAEPARRVAPPPGEGGGTPPPARATSECDTDDEIEEVVRRQKRVRPSPRAASPSPALGAGTRGGGADNDDSDDVEFVKDERIQGNITVEDSESGGETDAEAGGALAESLGAGLPALFAQHRFVLDAAFTAPIHVQLLARYCLAYGGLVLKPSEVEEDSECIVLCGSGSAAVELPCLRHARRLKAHWLWHCHARQALLPMDEYTLPDLAAGTSEQ